MREPWSWFVSFNVLSPLVAPPQLHTLAGKA
jgi:hypothetical protein